MQQMCACVEGGGDEAGVCVCLCECMYVCFHTVGGWFVVCKTYQNVEIQLTVNDHVPLHYTHHTLIYTLIPLYICTCILIIETPPRLPFQTPSLVVSSHFNLKGSSTSPSR